MHFFCEPHVLLRTTDNVVYTGITDAFVITLHRFTTYCCCTPYATSATTTDCYVGMLEAVYDTIATAVCAACKLLVDTVRHTVVTAESCEHAAVVLSWNPGGKVRALQQYSSSSSVVGLYTAVIMQESSWNVRCTLHMLYIRHTWYDTCWIIDEANQKRQERKGTFFTFLSFEAKHAKCRSSHLFFALCFFVSFTTTTDGTCCYY